MYFSMVHSHLNHGLLDWNFDNNRIIKLQKRCVRIITRSTYDAHTQPQMKQLNILSVPDMLLLNSVKFYYKYKRNEVPDYFASFNLQTQGPSQAYNTRKRDDIRTNRVRINLTEKCLQIYLPKTIDSIPNQILIRIDTHSMDGLAFAVKHHLISKYGMECQDDSFYHVHGVYIDCSRLTTTCIFPLHWYSVFNSALSSLTHWGQMTHICIRQKGHLCFI